MFSVWRAGFLHPFNSKTIPSSAWKKFQVYFSFVADDFSLFLFTVVPVP